MTTTTHTALPRWVGIALTAAAIVNVAAEAITAAAWDRRPYSYADDYVNFLGSPFAGTFQGVEISSPIWFVMTSGWILCAVLIAAASIRIGLALRGAKRWAIIAIATVQGIALILFAVVPLGPATLDNGLIGIYLLGAFGSIIAGNTLAILYGAFTKKLGTPRWVRATSMTLGILGLINIGATYGWAPIGVAERISVYSYLTWALLAGATLLSTRRRTSALPAGTQV